MIKIHELNKFYISPNGEALQVLKNINLCFEKAAITAIVGPSGSGKSTLSRCLSLLEQPTSGEIYVQDQPTSALSESSLRGFRQDIGVIFQSSALLQRRTARENIALPLQYLGVVEQQIQARVDELLAHVGLAHRADHYPRQLSGGQQQRIGIARALALHPKILIADEATSGLDPDATQSILRLLKQLKTQFSLSVILITHEMDVVRQLADHVAVLDHGEIVEQGQVVDLILDPCSQIGAQILPLSSVLGSSSDRHLLELVYSVERGTPADWLSKLSLRSGIEFAVLSANVVAIAGETVGRTLLGVERSVWQQQQQLILGLLDAFGLHLLPEPSTVNRPSEHAA